MNAGRRGAAQMRAKKQKLGEAGSGGAPRYARATAASCSSAHVTCEKSKKKESLNMSQRRQQRHCLGPEDVMI